jgi:hypothetical protein
MPPPDGIVPIGFEPKRWQAVVSAHNILSRAVQMDGAEMQVNWPYYISKVVSRIVAQHRARGVCIQQKELKVLLTDMATHLSSEKHELDRDTLTEFCMKYSRQPPDPLPLPSDLSRIMPCPMRNRRLSMCHVFSPLYRTQ